MTNVLPSSNGSQVDELGSRLSKIIINDLPARYVISLISHVDECNNMQDSDDEDDEEVPESWNQNVSIIIADPRNKKNYPYEIQPLVYETVDQCCVPATLDKNLVSSDIKMQSFLDKLKNTGFGDDDKMNTIENCVSVSIGLNRMLSVSDRVNKSLTTALNQLIRTNISYTVFGFFWKPRWFDKFEKSEVNYQTVRKFYKYLKKTDKTAADIFRKSAESILATETVKTKKGEKSKNVRIVPFQHLREYAVKYSDTQNLITKWHETDPMGNVYLHFTDDDTVSFNSVYSSYKNYLLRLQNQNKPFPEVMSSGYEFNEHVFALGSHLDRKIRTIKSNYVPHGVYFPEPNSCVLLEKNKTTLSASFINKSKGKGRDMESAALCANLRKQNPRAIFHFFDGNPIITTIPDRFRYKPLTRNGIRVRLDDKLSNGFRVGNFSPTVKDIETLTLLSQSELKSVNWWNNLFINGKEHKKDNLARKILAELFRNDYNKINDLKNVCEMTPKVMKNFLLAYAETEQFISHVKNCAIGDAKTYDTFFQDIQQIPQIITDIDTAGEEKHLVDLFKHQTFVNLLNGEDVDVKDMIDIALKIWEYDNDYPSKVIVNSLDEYDVDDIIKVCEENPFYLTFMQSGGSYEQQISKNFDNDLIFGKDYVNFFYKNFGINVNDIMKELLDDYEDEYDPEEKCNSENRFNSFREILRDLELLEWEWDIPSDGYSDYDINAYNSDSD